MRKGVTLLHNPGVMLKSENYVAKLMKSVAVTKLVIFLVLNQSLCSYTRIMSKVLEHLPHLIAAKPKFAIAQQLVSANLGSGM